MKRHRFRTAEVRILAAAVGAAFASAASAVSVDPEGFGQALIYPYYTVRATPTGDTYNTYISVTNATTVGKAVRVRVREGRAGWPVLDFNLFLSPNDVWTAAVVPTGAGAQILTRDRSCTDPPFTPTGNSAALSFGNANFSGPRADGFGETLDRTREGFIEMIEMAGLSGTALGAISHNSAGVPNNCGVVQGPLAPAPALDRPAGGLYGALTLINVNAGHDFAVNAVALRHLHSQPYYRRPDDPYPGFTAAEVEPVSVVRANGYVYRSVWSRPQDAVAAALMTSSMTAEYVLDPETASATDVVITHPMRHHYVNLTAGTPPYTPRPLDWSATCERLGDRVRTLAFNREERSTSDNTCPDPGPGCASDGVYSCAAASVGPAGPGNPSVLASTTRGLGYRLLGTSPVSGLPVVPGSRNGWFNMDMGIHPMTSLPSSTRASLATGQLTAGAHVHTGLPVVGFVVRTFNNSVMGCDPGACQRNYGGAFPFTYRRSISP